MAEYIDREKLINILPTTTPAGVVERKKGKWIYNPGGESEFDAVDFYICDQCGSAELEVSNFCPNCGADMRA